MKQFHPDVKQSNMDVRPDWVLDDIITAPIMTICQNTMDLENENKSRYSVFCKVSSSSSIFLESIQRMSNYDIETSFAQSQILYTEVKTFTGYSYFFLKIIQD